MKSAWFVIGPCAIRASSALTLEESPAGAGLSAKRLKGFEPSTFCMANVRKQKVARARATQSARLQSPESSGRGAQRSRFPDHQDLPSLYCRDVMAGSHGRFPRWRVRPPRAFAEGTYGSIAGNAKGEDDDARRAAGGFHLHPRLDDGPPLCLELGAGRRLVVDGDEPGPLPSAWILIQRR